MSRKRRKTRKKITVGEIREILALEEAAKSGDLEAAEKLAGWGDLEEYRAAAAEFIEGRRKLAEEKPRMVDSILGVLNSQRASEELRALDDTLGEDAKKALEAFKANSNVPDSFKDIFDDNKNLIAMTGIEPLRPADIWEELKKPLAANTILEELNEKIEPFEIIKDTKTNTPDLVYFPPGLLDYSRTEDRIAEEIAESNRLNRAILEELRKSGQMGAKTLPKKIELQVSVSDFLDWLNNWFLSKEWKNAMPFIEEVDDGYTCWGKPERKFDGAIIPLSIKKDKSWLDYIIQVSCQESSGNLTELELYYSPDIEPAVVDLVIAVNKKFRILAGSEPVPGLIENYHSKPVGYTPEQRRLIDQACIGWAGRGYSPSSNMSEFLNNFFRDKEIFLSVDQFKDALRDAGKRGLIVKVRRRWRLPETHP